MSPRLACPHGKVFLIAEVLLHSIKRRDCRNPWKASTSWAKQEFRNFGKWCLRNVHSKWCLRNVVSGRTCERIARQLSEEGRS